MPIDPQVQQLLAGMAEDDSPSMGAMTVQQMRTFYGTLGDRLGGPSQDMAEVKNLSAPGPAGDIPLRLYRPTAVTGEAQPGLIYVHGGGWVLGGLDSHEKICRRLAETCAATVVAMDYRLAPEHPFPAGPEDVIAASRWIMTNAAALKLDPARLGIVGDSAGGGLSAVACLANRGLPGPALCCQVLIYPGVDNSPEGDQRPSRLEQAQTPPLPATTMRMMADSYLPDRKATYDWRASPLLAADHAGLPAALVITGGFDPLRDEGGAYARCLAESGVEVLHRHYAGQVHGFIEMGGVLDAVEDAMQTIAFWFARCSMH